MRHGLPDAQWRAASDEMRDILQACAKDGRTVTYGELAGGIGAVHLEARHRRLTALLVDVCEREVAAGRPSLGALVVRKQTGIPGDGYFGGPGTLPADAATRTEMWRADLESVLDYWQSAETEPGGAGRGARVATRDV